MSKREVSCVGLVLKYYVNFKFIKNTLRALEDEECDLFRTECGDYYDNIYLCGHIAPDKWE